MIEIPQTIPYNFDPRDYQLPILKAMDEGINRAVCVWHRRSGKDKTFINIVSKKMFEKVGSYYYFFPTYNQGRKILWEGMDKDGWKFIDHIPKQLRKRIDNQSMTIEAYNGSVFRVIGTDNIDSIVGTNPIGCVFSEYSLQDPRAWDFIRPILAENGGWALFNFTPRGKNHGYRLKEYAKKSDKWFLSVLTVDDTKAIKPEILEDERNEIIAKNGNDALFMQEYYVSFDVPIEGSYYGHMLTDAERENRITRVPYDPILRVNTAWDLGIGDSTAIWFYQVVANEIRIIDFYESSGESLQHYIKKLQEKPYTYNRHYAPHDIEVRELTTGKTRRDTARSLGIDFTVASNIGIDDGINAVRNILPKCWFDEQKTDLGLAALRSYHKEYDDKNETYKNRPHHDWSSHAADAFRYLAVSFNEAHNRRTPTVRNNTKKWSIK